MNLLNQIPAKERRVTPRHVRPLLVKWRIVGARNYRYSPTLIQNISTTGMAFLFDEEFTAGTVLMVQFEAGATKVAEPMLMRVERCRREKNNKWQVGCSFSNPISREDLRALLELARKGEGKTIRQTTIIDPFIKAGASERRKSVRRQLSSLAVFVSRAGNGPEVPGTIVERSQSGLGIVVPSPFARGTSLKVRLQHDHVQSLHVKVRNCRAQDKQWFLGCLFTRTPPASVFMLLG